MDKLYLGLFEPITNKNYLFIADIEHEDDRVLVSCPSLPVYTEGSDMDEALKNLVEVITMFLEYCADNGRLEEVLEDHVNPPNYLTGRINIGAGSEIKLDFQSQASKTLAAM